MKYLRIPNRIPSRTLAFVTQHITIINVVCAWLVIILCVAGMNWQPLVADEHMLSRVAADWYRLRTLHVHPQLFIHWMQLCFLLFGPTVEAARIAVLLPNLVTVAAIPWLTQLVYHRELGRNDSRAISILAVWVFALSPLTIQNSILIDSDSSLLMLTTVLMVCLWFALQQRPALQRILLLGVGFAVCLWIKLTTPTMLVVALVLYSLLRQQWQEAGIAIGFSITGLLMFFLTHSVYSSLTGFTLADATGGLRAHFGSAFGGVTSILARPPQSLGVLLFWLSPGYALWLIAALFPGAIRLVHNRLNAEDVLIFLSLIVIGAYTLFIIPAWGYPRYYSPALPLMAVIASACLLSYVSRSESSLVLTFVMVAGMIATTAAIHFLVVGDPVYTLYHSTSDTTALNTRLRIGSTAFAKLIVPLLLALPVALISAVAVRRPSIILVALAVLTFGFNASTNFVQVTANYSTRYRYGQVYGDRQQAIGLVNRLVPPGGFTLTDPDILYFANRPGRNIFVYVSDNRNNPQLLIDVLKTRRVEAIAWMDKEWMKASILRSDPVLTELLKRCYHENKFGSFTVLLRHDSPSCAELS